MLILPCCEQSQTIKLDLEGTLKGKVITYDEFGWTIKDYDGLSVNAESGDVLLTTIVDSNGRYELINIPTGTYKIYTSKEGYGTVFVSPYPIVGGVTPSYRDFYIYKIPDIKIENLSLEMIDDDVYLIGSVIHDIEIDPDKGRIPTFRYFLNHSGNPSGSNFDKTYLETLNGEAGWQIYSNLSNNHFFSSGEQIWVIAYGCNALASSYYDFYLEKSIWMNLGEASNIASITIP